jgi:hypothetical protein
MVAGIDADWARRWATAHRTGADGQPQIEYDMDMNNNFQGRMHAYYDELARIKIQ